jgi:hypothetical protein
VNVAVIVVVPIVLPVATPLRVAIDAIPDDELQLTTLLMSCDVPSSNLPSAVNCCCVPTSIEAVAGVTVIESSVALVTVNVADPETPLMLALIVAEPAATAFASPITPLKFMVATEGADDFHVTCDVRSLLLPSLKLPFAVNWAVVPGAIEAVAGETVIEDSVTGGGFPPPPPFPPVPPLLELPPPQAMKGRLMPARSTDAQSFLILPPALGEL